MQWTTGGDCAPRLLRLGHSYSGTIAAMVVWSVPLKCSFASSSFPRFPLGSTPDSHNRLPATNLRQSSPRFPPKNQKREAPQSSSLIVPALRFLCFLLFICARSLPCPPNWVHPWPCPSLYVLCLPGFTSGTLQSPATPSAPSLFGKTLPFGKGSFGKRW